MANKEDFKIELKDFIDRNADNIEAIKKIKEEFIKKGFGINTPNLLFNQNQGNVTIDEINLLESIGISKILYKIGYNNFNPANFFTSSERDMYETHINQPEINENEIIFKNVIQYNDQMFLCAKWLPSEQAKARANRNIRYNFLTQRDPKYKVDRFGNVKKMINLNNESVEGIKKTIKDRKYFPPDTISLNIPILDGKIPQFVYDKDKLEFRIKVNYDIDSEHYTPLDITDGWHRDTAISELESELRKKHIDINDVFEGFPVQISLTTIEQAADFVRRQTKANKMSEEYGETMVDDGINKFIQKLNTLDNRNNNILNNNISKTFESMKMEDKLTNFTILRSGLKYIEDFENINFDSFNEQVLNSKKYVQVINIINSIMENEISRNYELPNIFVGYFALCVYVVKNKLNEDEILDSVNSFTKNIKLINDKDFKDLRLHQKMTDAKKIYNYFKELI
ncbi:MAG: hypothetical protein RR942_06405 [Romboutsia sp.]